ncbi:MAG: dUTP diphosphatase [Clostridiales bacterium]|nr:dUTP diphosphatase [Clostridiales bacterium]
MENLTIRIKKLQEKAVLPTYGTSAAAGADLYALLDAPEEVILPGETKLIHTGIALELPTGLAGFVYARSGLSTKRGLAPANKVGVIDPDYRGEILVALHNHSNMPETIADGERVAQLLIAPYVSAAFEEADTLSNTKRGDGGYGSTGRK